MRNKKSFTLIEILIVVAIIALLASITLPSMLRARINANEVGAIAVIRNITVACDMYQMKNSSFPSADDGGLEILAESSPPYIGSQIAQATAPETALKGYYYIYDSDGGRLNFTIEGRSARYGITGRKSFISDSSGVIHYTEADEAADLTDPAL